MDQLDSWVAAPAGAVTAVVAVWLLLALLTAGALRFGNGRVTDRTHSALDRALRALAPGFAGQALRAVVGLSATGTALVAGAALPAAAQAPPPRTSMTAPSSAPTTTAPTRTTPTATAAIDPSAPGRHGAGGPATTRSATAQPAPEARPAPPRRLSPPDLWPLSAPAGRDPAHAGDPHEVVVHRGDTLWSIAARHLPGHATNADIDAAWRSWFGANRAVIGSDPNLLLAGQVLHAPA